MPVIRRAGPVCIVGGGFAGTMVAANLARRGIASVLIEANGRAGMGAAYSTKDPAHLLNIPAETMGAWSGAPDDFVLREKVPAGSYAERRQFGRYLRSILDEAVRSGHVEVVDGRAVGADRNGDTWRVDLADGGSVDAEALVLALGNQPPATIPEFASVGDRLIDDPWSDRARAAIDDAVARNGDVLILGASLTMVDVALSLGTAGHKGRIVALSRRGKIPLSNGTDEAAPIGWGEVPPPRVRDIARWLRKKSSKTSWRTAVDSLRPHSHRLWQSLPTDQKRLFLRYGRPWWDIHRHRVAPQVGQQVDAMIADGRLQVLGGQAVAANAVGDAIEVTIRKRGHAEPEAPQRFDYLFNCTGPLGDIGRTQEPLLRGLLDDGSVKPDELAIGLSVDDRSRARPARNLWALGTLAKGRYWEIIAVPDIREQAAQVAADIAMELGK